jgi:acyl carrier protein
MRERLLDNDDLHKIVVISSDRRHRADPRGAVADAVMTKSVNERLTFILTSEMDVPPEKIMPSATFQSLGFDSMRQIDFALLVEMEFPQIDVDQHPFDKLITLGELEFEIEKKIALDARGRAA